MNNVTNLLSQAVGRE